MRVSAGGSDTVLADHVSAIPLLMFTAWSMDTAGHGNRRNNHLTGGLSRRTAFRIVRNGLYSTGLLV